MSIDRSTIIFQHKLDKLVQIYENDQELKDMLIKYDLYLYDEEEGIPLPERIEQYETILSVFINNSEEISDTTITDLLLVTEIRSQIDAILIQSVDPITDEMYRQFLYSFKYGVIKSFFLDNHQDFMPSYDSQIMQDSLKMKIWQEAFMRQFDIFVGKIDDIIENGNIDIIAEEYLDYMAQLVGFERGDTNLGDSLFREITKNIIEVYRIKGTNYSFELFFNFIGFEIDVIEYYFDRRFYKSNNVVNPYTKETSLFKFGRYLTPHDPTQHYPENIAKVETVLGSDMVPVRNGLVFDKDMEVGSATLLEKYLGYVDWDEDDDPNIKKDETFTYFKTNVIEYSISKLSNDEIPSGLTQEDEETIQAYTNFLTPIFVSKKVVINITPFEDDANNVLNYKDSDLLINDILTSMFYSLTTGTYKPIYNDEWVWDLNSMDRIINNKKLYVLEDYKTASYSNSLYDEIEEPISSFDLSYPYIENKPDTDENFTLTSSDFLLTETPSMFGDILKMSLRDMNYYGHGTALTFATVTAIVSVITNPFGGIIIGGSANSSVEVIYEGSGQVDASGSVNSSVEVIYEGSGQIIANGEAETKGFVYDGSGQVDLSGIAPTAFSVIYEGNGQVDASGNASYSVEVIYEGNGQVDASGAAETSAA